MFNIANEYAEALKKYGVEKEKEFLTSKEVMDRLRISRATLYRLIKQGKFHCTKIGRNWKFYKKSLDWRLYPPLK